MKDNVRMITCYIKQHLCNFYTNLSILSGGSLFVGVELIRLSGSKILTGTMTVAIYKAALVFSLVLPL